MSVFTYVGSYSHIIRLILTLTTHVSALRFCFKVVGVAPAATVEEERTPCSVIVIPSLHDCMTNPRISGQKTVHRHHILCVNMNRLFISEC